MNTSGGGRSLSPRVQSPNHQKQPQKGTQGDGIPADSHPLDAKGDSFSTAASRLRELSLRETSLGCSAATLTRYRDLLPTASIDLTSVSCIDDKNHQSPVVY